MNTLKPTLTTAAPVVELFLAVLTAVYFESVSNDFSQRDCVTFERLGLQVSFAFSSSRKSPTVEASHGNRTLCGLNSRSASSQPLTTNV